MAITTDSTQEPSHELASYQKAILSMPVNATGQRTKALALLLKAP